MKHFLLLVTASMLVACAHHDDVRPSAQNSHYVVVNSQQRDEGIQDALKQARHYCQSLKAKMYVLNETVSYEGSQPEADYLAALKTAEIVSGVGTALWIFGDGRVDDAGAIASVAGNSAEHAMGRPYVTKINFKCDM
ncbi:hypothetical protein ACFOEE_03495 [Pseudoalteromonas fenneropenaei]|uniref:Lipoprotein n=1 Tax=Pseudoalteromonas fenneropenaei TaxID=1737459 RepID=A0ABV7CG90_9GAMM